MFNYQEEFYEERKIGVSAEKAWAQLSIPASLPDWHPFMETVYCNFDARYLTNVCQQVIQDY
jgi:hypothetical protein